MPKTEVENLAENANSQLREENSETGRQAGNTQPHAAPLESLGRASALHGDGLPVLPGQQSLQATGRHQAIVPSKTEPAQGLGTSRQARPKLRASWSKATLPWQQHCLEEEELPEQTGHDHLASLPWLDGRARQANPELTGLEGLEAISSQQKVLEWLEAYFDASTTYALPALPWQEPWAPALQAGTCLLPKQPLGHASPPATAAHGPARHQPRSLLVRLLGAARRLFLGSCVPPEWEQQRRAHGARQVPGGDPAEPQRRPADSTARAGTPAVAAGTAPQPFACPRRARRTGPTRSSLGPA
ncbi:uncharacterized protein LOC113988610 [Pipra filicauda]|uniref:Uncharacterized protein LOC113988610 n=1 Tax=Pipra filicauda TaxID=649802 RepID=A0A6J2GS50_9PASS|nr:uncharacterized protein LOC113988610 [Pipra filicauda]